MTGFLVKLGSIADFADQNGQYELVADIKKTAQIFDALRTLFDPKHTPGVDRNTPFWKRLSKGWERGKMDRNLGLVLAIMTERTKLNKKIDNLTAPIKEFQERVAAFYEKMRAGQIKSDDLRSETRELQNGLKETLKLITGKELKQVLKLKERLESQQLIAADRIKGLDDETKDNLMAVLKGDGLPGAQPSQVNNGNGAGSSSNTGERMAKWMRSIGVAKSRSLHEGRQSKNINMFRPFVTEYQVNPAMVLEFFNANPQQLEKGFDMFGKDFANMYYWAENSVKNDRSAAEKEKQIPGSEAKVEPAQDPKIEQKMEKENQNPLEVSNEGTSVEKGKAPQTPVDGFSETKVDNNVIPNKRTEVMPAPMFAPPEHGLTPDEDKLRREVAMERQHKEQEREKAKIKELIEYRQKQKEKEEAKKIQPSQQPLVEPGTIVDKGLSAKSSERISRSITRLGRVQKLRKLIDNVLVVNAEDEGYADDKKKVVIRHYEGEYRVPAPDKKEDGAYYTNDKEDAIQAAKHIYGKDIEIVFRSGYPKTSFADDTDDELLDFLDPKANEHFGDKWKEPFDPMAPQSDLEMVEKHKQQENYPDDMDIPDEDSDDIMDFSDGRERFDENKHVNEDEVEYYKGKPDDWDDDARYDEQRDIRNLGKERELDPYDDEEIFTDRPNPVLQPASKKEKLEDVMKLIRILDKRIENSNGSGSFRSDMVSLEKARTSLINRKKQLSELPENWADDGEFNLVLKLKHLRDKIKALQMAGGDTKELERLKKEQQNAENLFLFIWNDTKNN